MHDPKQKELATGTEIPLLEEEEGMTINCALEISTIHKGKPRNCLGRIAIKNELSRDLKKQTKREV